MKWDEWVERLARFGYVCKGIVYVIIGLLAAATIVGRGQPADRQYAFHYILEKPFGRLLLIVIAFGLIGYAAWRISSGIDDSENHGADAKGLAIRFASIARGVFYGWIAIELTRQVLEHHMSGKTSDTQARHWTARAMDEPFGRWVVAIAGACVIGYSVWQLIVAATGRLPKQIRKSVPAELIAIARFGIAARAVVFAIVGGSLISAAIRYTPAKARGTSGAMRTIAIQPFGPWLLALTGIGFAAYGVYAFINARYRRIEAE